MGRRADPPQTDSSATEPPGSADFLRLEELFIAASELPLDEQRAFLEEQEGDPALRAEVLELLGHSFDAEKRVGAAVDAGMSWVADEPDHPERLGPYRILRELGRGGLGVVYLAERDDEQFHMRVAIKVVRPGMEHHELGRRLQRERQILAGLEHPNIARVLDGGTTDNGAPFLVMELVDGEPITDYCRRHHLSIERRLAVFRQVCNAVHYAHRSLVLHRDLKPSNILVTEGDVPKLLDFGIAKMLERPEDWLDEQSATATLTGPGMRLLTPEYASPEQVLGRPLTTSSDVYSLGVLLHELLTGDRPYGFDRHRPSEIERVVCEDVPERPSLSHRRLAGTRAPWDLDLDNIVAMALRKEPERRYASALQLSEDIRNYLSDLPVVARADTLSYRMSKFVRRHRAAVSAAVAVALTLITAVVMTSRQAEVAQRERLRAEASLEVAERERLHAQEVAEFMANIFENSDPSRSRRASVTAREVLDQGARQIAWQLRERTELRQTLMTTMAKVYRQLDLYDEAESLLAESRALQTKDRRGNAVLDDQEISSIRELALLRLDQGELDLSERLLRSSTSFTELRHGPDSPLLAEHLMDLGRALRGRDAHEEAEEVMQRALDIRIRSYGERDAGVAEIRDQISQLHYARGDYKQAETLCRRALEDRRRALGEDHPDVALSLNNLAVIRLALADLDEATELLEEALQLRRRLYGDVHGSVSQSLLNLGNVKLRQRDLDQAEPLLTEALEVYEKIYGDDHSEVAEALYSLSLIYRRRDIPRAEKTLQRVLDIRRKASGNDHPSVVQGLLALARLYRKSDPDRAESQFREAIDLQGRILAPDDHRRSYALLELAKLLLDNDKGNTEEAETLSRQAYELRANALPEDHWETAFAQAHWGRSIATRGRVAAGRELLITALRAIENHLGPDHRRARDVRSWLEDLEESNASG